MAPIPRTNYDNLYTDCLFILRQLLWMRLNQLVISHLSPEHKAIQFIDEIQPVFSSLIAVYPLILQFNRFSNNNEPTWTHLDKEWYFLQWYQSIWNTIEKFFRKCFLIAADGDEDLADEPIDEIGGDVMTCAILIQCPLGVDFFKTIVNNNEFAKFIKFLDKVQDRYILIQVKLGDRGR